VPTTQSEVPRLIQVAQLPLAITVLIEPFRKPETPLVVRGCGADGGDQNSARPVRSDVLSESQGELSGWNRQILTTAGVMCSAFSFSR